MDEDAVYRLTVAELKAQIERQRHLDGQIEKTMFTKFCCTQNLKVLYNTTQLPSQLHDMVKYFEDNFSSDLRGTRLSDVFAEDDRFGVPDEDHKWELSEFSSLADDDFVLLRNWMSKYQPTDTSYSRRVVIRESIYRFGQRFTSRSTSIDDSHVIFMEDGKFRAGSILGIFSRATVGGPTSQTWAIIQPYLEVSDEIAAQDPYLDYPIIGGALFQNSWNDSTVLVDMKSVLYHFASAILTVDGLSGEFRLVLPLNKI
ncbi:hypothetical protein CVT24_010473 [Panaeolus cyanescens]|uniref:Uncharacterized protein n=1 Tax=Panaeolus cyanescens TaxID=181874 RepID=A0A409WAT1_9AGAR|nr:hypothetical protein CVT24_010473 [Panaeolus cyanescens]